MENSFKYLAVSDEDLDWGLYLNTAGSLKVLPNKEYPSPNHPNGYFFTWEDGRYLQEYQLNYIIEGSGTYENKHGTFKTKPGSLMVTTPNTWHRYKPTKSKGWTEIYVGFNGPIAENFLSHNRFNPTLPVINVGIKEEILDTYLKIFDLIKKEHPGYQQIVSGMIIKLLGYVIAFDKRKGFSGKKIATIIEEARFMMHKNVDKTIDLEAYAISHSIGYTHFRRMFKNYTGLSPHQYHLQLKIMRAKELLLSTDRSIKEISYDLGFESIHYFSRFFKKKTGINPSDFSKPK